MRKLERIEQVTWSWCLQRKLVRTHQRSDIVNVLAVRDASNVGYGSVRDGLRVGRAGCWRRKVSESSGDDGWRCRLRLGLELAQPRDVRAPRQSARADPLVVQARISKSSTPDFVVVYITYSYSTLYATRTFGTGEQRSVRLSNSSSIFDNFYLHTIRNLRASIAVNPITTMSQNDTSAAWPQADQALSTEILDLVQQSTHARQLKKGTLGK
jgi:hypothetical protein